MAKFDVVDIARNKVGEIELADEIFSQEQNPHLFYEVVKMQQANRRRGTVAVKNASLVSGSNKKPYRQKGTGRARQGSHRASQWVGGGKAMGPKPRDYFYRPSRKVRRAALAKALSLRANQHCLLILNEFPSNGKTKQSFEVLTKGLGLKSALVIDEKSNGNLLLSIRNLTKFDVLPPEALNLESILKRKNLVLTQAAAKQIETALLQATSAGEG
ncbi:MAG: 50S ribosomal protein L4 [Cystobacterineae bacterium]|nr:50S ribosomal protein L4 [Cystobacterineae bacterium]